MIPVTFMGLPVSVYQDSKISYSISYKETREYSGQIHAAVSPIKTTFPRSFDCYTEDISEINNLSNKIGSFGTLIINGTSYTNCYISDLGDRFEIVRGSGKYTYAIQFSQATTNALTDQVYASEEPLTLYDNQSLSAGMTLDYPTPVLLRGLAYANISVENTGFSENFTVICYGSYDSTGSILTPVFVCNLNTTTTTRADTISNPQNYLFVHAQNDDSVHDTTFKIILSKVATL